MSDIIGKRERGGVSDIIGKRVRHHMQGQHEQVIGPPSRVLECVHIGQGCWALLLHHEHNDAVKADILTPTGYLEVLAEDDPVKWGDE